MNLNRIILAAALSAGLALAAPPSPASEFFMPTRFVVDLAPGSDPNRVAQVLQAQGINVVRVLDMPDGPAVSVDVDLNNPPNVDALRPLLPEVVGYGPDVPRELQTVNPPLNDINGADGETLPWGIQAVQAPQVSYAVGRKVCIIDTGYDLGHPDLQTTRVSGTDNGAGPWYGSTISPVHPHGTHVAGTRQSHRSSGCHSNWHTGPVHRPRLRFVC